MKQRPVLSASIFLVVLLIFAVGNSRAFGQLMVYLPLILKNSTSYSTPEPSPEPTQPPKTTGNIVIVTIHYDGTGSSEPDEFVEIRNDDILAIRLANWTLRDEANHIFTFPYYVIIPTFSCRIYTNEIHPDSCGFSYGSSSAIWNNGGDTAYLRDGNGTLIAEYSY